MPYPIKARNPVTIFTLHEVDNRFTHSEFTAQQLGIYSRRNWTNSIYMNKFNQLVDDAAKKFEVAQAVNFADLAKQAQLQAKFSQFKSQYNIYFNKLFINRKEFTLRRLHWRDLFNGKYLKASLIGSFGYPRYVLNKIAVILTVFIFLQCLFGLFRRAFNAYNHKSLLLPNIT